MEYVVAQWLTNNNNSAVPFAARDLLKENATFVKAESVRHALSQEMCQATLLNALAATGKR